MATTLFNNIILAAASRVKDARTSALASDDGNKRYSSAQWAKYLNTSIRDLLIENIQKYDLEMFSDIFPEYVKTGGNVTILANSSGGYFAKPSDCFTMMDLRVSTLFIRRIKSEKIQQILTDRDPLIVPSAAEPIFYQEGASVYVLGISSGSATPRYIKTHQDIVPTTGSAGNGKYCTTPDVATWTVATRRLNAATMNIAFDANDVGKKIVVVDKANSVIFDGIIDSYISASSVTISGDGIGTQNLSAGDIDSVAVLDRDLNDLQINQYWHGELINRTVAYALKDAKDFAS